MITTSDLFKMAYEGSFYTIIGCGGDLADWKNGYDNLLAEKKIGKPSAWYQFTGADMNAEYGLTGNNAYPDDLRFLCFPLDGLDVGRLAIFKLIAGDRWFDDIVDNNLRREEEQQERAALAD